MSKRHLATETVQGTALALESVDNVERSNGLALGVLGVGDGVTDDGLQEGLEDTAGLLVDHGRDTLDTATASETADSGLGDTLDVVTQDLAVTLGAALAETLAALSTCGLLVYRLVYYMGLKKEHGDSEVFLGGECGRVALPC
jgi:hypothetical protein